MLGNDEKAMQTTEIAYLNCLEKGQRNLLLQGKKGPFTIRNLILAAIDVDSIKQYMEADGKDFNQSSIQAIVQYSDLSKRDQEYISCLSNEALSWEIVGFHNTTGQNGFYGCVIKTGRKNGNEQKDEYYLSIRGSEGLGALKSDWLEADFALLNHEETEQMKETENFIQRVYESHILDNADSVNLSGFSLGGNLANHAAVVLASNLRYENILNKLDRVDNFDGPGVSDEYLSIHKSAIKKIANKITHYKWSVVGDLLYSFPGENETRLATEKYEGNQYGIKSFFYNRFIKHDIQNVDIKRGKIQRGEKDEFAQKVHNQSMVLEQFPMLTQALHALCMATVGKMIYQDKEGKLKIKLPFIDHPKDEYDHRYIYYENVPESQRNIVRTINKGISITVNRYAQEYNNLIVLTKNNNDRDELQVG